MKTKLIFIAIALSAFNAPAFADMAQIRNRFGGQLSDGFTATQKNATLTALDRLSRMQFQIHRGSWFRRIFGGLSSASVLDYLDERIHAIYSPDESIQLYARHLSISRDYDGGRWHPIGFYQPFSDPTIRATLGALNYSRILAFEQLRQPNAQLGFELNGYKQLVTAGRLGVVILGESFLTVPNTPVADYLRASSLIHEARHSDCKRPLSEADRQLVLDGGVPLSSSCGYLHGTCPSHFTLPNGERVPHPYAGQLKCDSMPWGAYSIELIFSQEVQQHCLNCDQETRQAALIVGADTAIRYSSSVEQVSRMLSGELGPPVMSSAQ